MPFRSNPKAARYGKSLGAILMIIGLWWVLVGGDAKQNLRRAQKEQLTRLRKALADNMNEFVKPGTGATFLPEGKIERLTHIDKVVFDDYVKGCKPFILSNPDIKCTKSNKPWDLSFLREQAGDDVVGVETSTSNRFYSNEGLKKVRMTVAEFLDVFKKNDRKVDFYLAEEDIKQFPRLDADASSPEFTDDLNLDKTQLWVGAGGQVSPLHHDQWDNILCQIQGTRKVTLYDPFQTDFLYPKTGINRHFSQLDPANPDLSAFPDFASAVPASATVHAGEILFVPAHWWHQVHHESSVNIAVNFWFLPSLLGELLMDTILPDGPNY